MTMLSSDVAGLTLLSVLLITDLVLLIFNNIKADFSRLDRSCALFTPDFISNVFGGFPGCSNKKIADVRVNLSA